MLEEDAAEIAGVFLLNSEGEWESAKHPLNRYATDRKQISMQRFGLSGPFASAVRKANREKTIGLIVNARGGSNIDEWKRGQPLYDHTMKRVADAKISKFAGIVWLQGYSNAKDTEYLAKLKTLISSLRADLQQAELPVVIGQVPIYEKDSPVNLQILKAPEAIEHSAVATNENTKKFDAYHYDRNGYITMGERLAAAYLKLVEKE